MAAQDGQATSPLERSGALVDTGARQERPAEVAPAETEALVAIGAGQGMSVASTLALVDTAVRAKSKAKDLVPCSPFSWTYEIIEGDYQN